MEIQFLGTSSGTPTRTRNVSGLALRSVGSRHWSLIDCGEGTQHRVMHTSLSLMDLKAIFITHVHGDHSYGLPGLLASAGMLNRSEQMFVVGPRGIQQFVECALETSQLQLPYPIEFVDVLDVPGKELLPDFDVQVTSLSHRVPSFAFSFTEKAVERKLDAAKLESHGIAPGPMWGELQQGNDVSMADGEVLRARDYLLPPRKRRKVIVGGDNDTPELLAAEAKTAEVLIHEATYTQEIMEKIGPAPQHSSAKLVAQFAQGARIRNLVLTHFSPRYQDQEGKLTLADVAAEARTFYRGNLFLASDLERYVLDRQGNLSKPM